MNVLKRLVEADLKEPIQMDLTEPIRGPLRPSWKANFQEVTAMSRWKQHQRGQRVPAPAAVLLTTMIAAVSAQTAFALITGGVGNDAKDDAGWPAGAAAIFNHPSRVAWWEGPPFGGGQWHAECQGDAKALSAVLVEFAELDVTAKRIVVHDGIGYSFWLNPNGEPAKQEAARIDWTFMVWQPAHWERLRALPPRFKAVDASDARDGPPSQIEVYVGGNLRWADVTVPKGLMIVDERLEAHGFKAANGTVLEGTVVDLVSKRPLAARMKLQRIEPQPTGGYKYTSRPRPPPIQMVNGC